MSVLDQPRLDARTGPSSRIRWLSLGSACLAWMFAAMDLTLFTLVTVPSVSELIGSSDPALVAHTAGLIAPASCWPGDWPGSRSVSWRTESGARRR